MLSKQVYCAKSGSICGHPFLILNLRRRIPRELFMNSVERVFVLRGSSRIRRFYLNCNVLRNASCVNLWVSAAVQRNVEERSLFLSDTEGPFALPYCLFTSTSSTCLLLFVPGVLQLLAKIHLPNLKYLNLKNIIFFNEGSTQQLLSCPALEELTVKDCNWSYLMAVTVFTPMLEILTLQDEDLESHWMDLCGCQVIICANNLERFSCKNPFLSNYYLNQSCSLLEAVSDAAKFPLSRSREAAYHKQASSRDVVREKFGTVDVTLLRSLYLSSEIHVLTNTVELILAVFGNLRSLNLGHLDLKCGAVCGLLHYSPLLEMLEFCEMIGLCSNDEENSGLLNLVPRCFMSHLKQIKIDDFVLSFEKIHVVKLLLKHAIHGSGKTHRPHYRESCRNGDGKCVPQKNYSSFPMDWRAARLSSL